MLTADSSGHDETHRDARPTQVHRERFGETEERSVLVAPLSVIARGTRFFLVAFLLNRYGPWARKIIEERLTFWVTISFVVQPHASGLCDAIFQAAPLIAPTEPVCIGLPDTIWFPEDALCTLPDDQYRVDGSAYF